MAFVTIYHTTLYERISIISLFSTEEQFVKTDALCLWLKFECKMMPFGIRQRQPAIQLSHWGLRNGWKEIPPNYIACLYGRRHCQLLSLAYQQGFICVLLLPAISKSPRAFLYGWLPLSNAYGISFINVENPNLPALIRTFVRPTSKIMQLKRIVFETFNCIEDFSNP